MPQQYTTLGQSTLAAAYTTGDPTIQVTDPSTFPSDPEFHIRFVAGTTGGAIYKVTAVASDVLSVTLEFGTDINAAIGVNVFEVITKDMLDGIRSDIHGLDVIANLPSSPTKGDQFRSSDGYYHYHFDGSVWQAQYHGMLVKPPSQSFVWKNQQSSTENSTKGPVVMIVPPSGSVNCSFRVTAVVPPFTAIACIHHIGPSVQYTPAGFVFYDNAAEDWRGIGYGMDNTLFLGFFAGSNFSNYSVGGPIGIPISPLWVKLVNDTVNMEYWVSTDGLHWGLWYTEAVGSFANDFVGIAAGASRTGVGDNMIVLASLDIF